MAATLGGDRVPQQRVRWAACITRRIGESQPYARNLKDIPVPCRKDAVGAALLRLKLGRGRNRQFGAAGRAGGTLAGGGDGELRRWRCKSLTR